MGKKCDFYIALPYPELRSEKLKQMISVNKSRIDYQQKLQGIIDDYNQGSSNIDIYYYDLIDEVKELSIEDQRHIAEQLTEEELAIFDLLTRPEMMLSEDEKKQVKKVARDLLETLKREKLVLDWHKKRDTQAQVEETIMQILNLLPGVYTKEVYDQKCVEVYNHIYASYRKEGNMPAA